MGLVFSLALAAGMLLNGILTGFTGLNITYIIIVVFLTFYNLPFIKKSVTDTNRKRAIITGVLVYSLAAGAAMAGTWIYSMKDDTLSFYRQMSSAAGLLREGKYSDAEKELLRLHAREPSDASVNQNLAVVYLNTGMLDEAKKYIDAAYTAKPFDEGILYDYGLILYENRDYKNAQRYFEEACRLNPVKIDVNLYAGMASFKLRELRRAIYRLERTLTLERDSTEALYFLGRSYMELMEYSKAGKYFNRILELKPDKDMEVRVKGYLLDMESAKEGEQYGK